jgi:hypothetical protein
MPAAAIYTYYSELSQNIIPCGTLPTASCNQESTGYKKEVWNI